MKLKINRVASLVIIESLNCLYVIIFYGLFNVNKETISFSVMHSLMSGIIIYQQYCIFKDENRLSLGGLLIYVFSMYYQFSIIKYCRTGVFYGFTEDNSIRFIGTKIAFCVLFVVNWFRVCKKKHEYEQDFRIDYKIFGAELWSWILCLILFIYYFFIYRYDNSIYLNNDYQAQSIFVTILIHVLLCTSVYLAGAYWKKENFITFIPIAIELCAVMYNSLRTGSRALFFTYSLLVVYMILKRGFFKVKILSMLLVISPWIMIIFTYAAFAISGRYSANLMQVVAMNLAYRFDLTDFAINILDRSSWFRLDYSEIFAGFMNCIPSFLTTKFKGFFAYKDMLSSLGLIDSVDYSDTFFSMGASVCGIIGMILIVPVFYGLYEKIDWQLERNKANGEIIRLICMLTLLRIEIEWISFIPGLRNMIVEILIVIIFGRLLGIRTLSKTGRVL